MFTYKCHPTGWHFYYLFIMSENQNFSHEGINGEDKNAGIDLSHDHSKDVISTPKISIPGMLSVIMDGGAGSSGKGKLGAYLFTNKLSGEKFHFSCSNSSSNASHTVVIGGDTYVLKHLSSAITVKNSVEKVYVGQGSAIDLDAIREEIKLAVRNEIAIGIDPMSVIIQDIDIGYEKGTHDFDGNPKDVDIQNSVIRSGSTCSGSGAARARKVMRKSNTLLARDIDWLRPYLCNVSDEITNRLNDGQCGLLEIPQGYQLSYGLDKFYPHTTSRNSTVAAGFDDMMVSPGFLGAVVINFRTFPIRISSKKYIVTYGSHAGKHLTWDEVQSGQYEYEEVDSNSGGGYDDQEEITWDLISENVGEKVMETTTLTKLPRRIFTFSLENMHSAIKNNYSKFGTYISINFINYLNGLDKSKTNYSDLSEQSREWLSNISDQLSNYDNVTIGYLGTGKDNNDMITLI